MEHSEIQISAFTFISVVLFACTVVVLLSYVSYRYIRNFSENKIFTKSSESSKYKERKYYSAFKSIITGDNEKKNSSEGNQKVSELKVNLKKQRKIEQKDRNMAAKQEEELENKQRLIRREEQKNHYLQKKEKLEEERLAQEELIKQQKLEQEKIAEEEYLQHKNAFIVDEKGESSPHSEYESSLLQSFIDYINERRVVEFETLACHFGFKTAEAIERINTLQNQNLITGIVDERGKFICVTVSELSAIAEYIKRYGRISFSDLSHASGSLINVPHHSS